MARSEDPDEPNENLPRLPGDLGQVDLSKFVVRPGAPNSRQSAERRARNEKGETQQLWSELIHRRKMELLAFLVQNYSLRDAAKAVGIHYSTARNYVRDPEMLTKLRDLSQSVYDQVYTETVDRKLAAHQRIQELADAALTKMEELLEAENENVQFKVAQDLLDREGSIPRQSKSIGIQTHIVVDADMLQLAAKAAQELEGPRKLPKGKMKPDGQ